MAKSLKTRATQIKREIAFEEYQSTTLWSFPERGSWATHRGDYRGNFAPQIPRNVIEMYSEAGETVLDPMVGGGTTLIEARLLGRHGIGVDINPAAVKRTKEALAFNHHPATRQEVRTGDARDLSFLSDGSVDLAVTHPPYLNIIRYSEPALAGDLSAIGSLPRFCDEIQTAAAELLRVLRPGRFCAVLMGDTRRGRHFVPLAYHVMRRFQRAGFILREDIIKAQHNCTTTRRWQGKSRREKFYLIMHEHLFVFRKPEAGEDLSRLRYSRFIAEP